MTKCESYCVEPLDEVEKKIITNIKAKNKLLIIIGIPVLILLIAIGPFVTGRTNGRMFVDDFSYLNTVIGITIFVILCVVIPFSIYYSKWNADFKLDTKIVVKSQIAKITKKDRYVKLVFTCPELKSVQVKVANGFIYPDIAVNDCILISYLPNTMHLFEFKKLISNV
jgi:hypothetical protein